MRYYSVSVRPACEIKTMKVLRRSDAVLFLAFQSVVYGCDDLFINFPFGEHIHGLIELIFCVGSVLSFLSFVKTVTLLLLSSSQFIN